MRTLIASLTIAATGATGAAQPATSTTAQAAARAESQGVLLAAKVGGFVPLDGLSPFVSFGLEVGYALPAHLAVVVDVDYTQPTKTGVEMDPRVAGGMYTWKLTEQELGLMPAIEYRIPLGTVTPYAGIGPRVLFARSTVRDNGTPAIESTKEQSTRVGVGVPVGAELALGPGAALAELLFQYGTLNHVATGDANTGALSVSLGYRFRF